MSLNDTKKWTQIDFEALAFVRASMGANQLYEIILKSIDRNISCVEAGVTNTDRPLHTFVFYPKVLGHFMSYVYPTTAADDGKYEIISILKAIFIFKLNILDFFLNVIYLNDS